MRQELLLPQSWVLIIPYSLIAPLPVPRLQDRELHRDEARPEFEFNQEFSGSLELTKAWLEHPRIDLSPFPSQTILGFSKGSGIQLDLLRISMRNERGEPIP